MAGTTSKGLRYPTAGDNPAVHTDIKNLADDVDSELNDYLTTASASSTYLTTSSASSTYLTISNASSTYSTKADALHSARTVSFMLGGM